MFNPFFKIKEFSINGGYSNEKLNTPELIIGTYNNIISAYSN
jgi:hypothetical protein